MLLLNAKPIQPGTAFEHAGILYPSNWIQNATQAERAAIGMTEIVEQPRPDDRFFIVNYDEANPGQWISNPKELAPLKTSWVTTERATAYSMLLTSDWMIVRAIENPAKPIPAEWTTYRAAVRTECERLVTAIEASTDIPSLITAINSAKWPSELKL